MIKFILGAFLVVVLTTVASVHATTNNSDDHEKVKFSISLCEKQVVSGGPILVRITCTNIGNKSIFIVHPTTLWNNVAYSIYNENGDCVAKTFPDHSSVEMPVDYAVKMNSGETLTMYDDLARLIKVSLDPGMYKISATYLIPSRVYATVHGPVTADPLFFEVNPSSTIDKIVRKLLDKSWTGNKKTNEQILVRLIGIIESEKYEGVHAPYIKYHIGRILYKLDRLNEALLYLNSFTDQQRGNNYYYVIGATLTANTYIKLHDYGKAADCWESMPPTLDRIKYAERLRSKAR